MRIEELIKLPNENHGIKECVLTIFLKTPIKDLETFPEFFTSTLKTLFQRYDTVKNVNYTLTIPTSKNKELEHKIEKEQNSLGGFRLYRHSEDKSTEIITQFVNEKDRRFFSIHCLNYSSWDNFKTTSNEIIGKFEKWLKNDILAFNLYYVDEFKSTEQGKTSLDRIFKRESDLLPSGFFTSENTYLVFNTERPSTENSFFYFDKIELKNQRKVMSIGHSTVVPIDNVRFDELCKSNETWTKIDWAHKNNKDFLKDILSTEVQEYIGLLKEKV